MQNWLAGANLSEWHTGYRAYAVKSLARIGFALNTNDFHFDTEILLQLIKHKAKFVEINIPTHYGDEICHVNGINYAKNVIKASFKFFLQKYHLFYDVRFHPEVFLENEPAEDPVYEQKLNFYSPHTYVCKSTDLIPEKSKVLDIGSSTGYVADELTKLKSCEVTGLDLLPPSKVPSRLFRYHQVNLETEETKVMNLLKNEAFDVILMLDLIEHLAKPEHFLLELASVPYQKIPKVFCSTANVGFIVIRLMLLFGHFNYGQKGILDITHKRLFSIHTFKNLLEQTGFVTQKEIYFPFPFQTLGFSEKMTRILEKINIFLIKIRPRLFSYQVMIVACPLAKPTVVLKEALVINESRS
jgi:2-polyprenyl-3-methyl-5-hydroxy-6-metoxy-1,4-benzoquinol methylase